MATIKNPLPAGGGGSADIVNGVIEQYLAENETVDANTFVEFVNHWSEISTQNGTAVLNSSSDVVKAALLDTNKVIIVYYKNGGYPFGIALTIDNGELELGTAVQLLNDGVMASSYNALAVVGQTTAQATVICYATGMKFFSCTVSDSRVITASTTTSIISAATSSNVTVVKYTKGNSGNLFVGSIQSSGSGSSRRYYFSASACVVGSSSISFNASQTVMSLGSSISGVYAGAGYLSNGYVFVTIRASSSISGTVCIVGASTISTGTNTQLIATTGRSLAVSEGYSPALVCYESASSPYDVYGLACTVSGTTPTAGTATLLSSGSGYASSYVPAISIANVGNGKLLVGCNAKINSSVNLYGVLCSIQERTITAEYSAKIPTFNNTGNQHMGTLLVLDEYNMLAVNNWSVDSSNGGDEATIVSIPVALDPTVIISNAKVDGLTKTACTAETAGDVWVLDTT